MENITENSEALLLQEKWNQVLHELINQTSVISFDMWIKKLEPIAVYSDKLYIKAPTNIVKKVCNDSFSFLLSQGIEKVFEVADYEILNPEEYEEFVLRSSSINEPSNQTKKTNNTINAKYTFDNFVVGNCNKFVYSACKAVAESPGTKFNPLFIYGGVGLGKTHLLHAIGNYLLENNPNINVLYKTCENFTNDYLDCVRNKNKDISKFREMYRSVDVLMIDDIQEIANKESTQLEFFNTFNDLHQLNKQIIISSDRPPSEINTLSDRMVSRFSMGLIQDIQSPDFETRYIILQKKAQLENNKIDNDALEFIAQNITSNIRELEGALNKTVHLALLKDKKSATLEDAQETLKAKMEEITEFLTPSLIIDQVCKYYRIEKKDLLGTKRNKELVEPRHICIYLMCELLNMPMATIGKEIFNRDHTSIMHARNKIIDNIATNDKIRRDVNDLKSLIQNR